MIDTLNTNQTKSSNTGNAKLRLFEHAIWHQIFGAKWLSAVRLFLYGLTTIIILPFQVLALSTCLPLRISIPVLHHKLITNKPMLVCGNTADMLSKTWLSKHFDVYGDKSVHYGLFDSCNPVLDKNNISNINKTSSCC